MLNELNTEDLLESVSDAILSTDAEMRYIYANTRATQLLGLPRDQMMGRRVDEVFPEIVGTPFYEKIQSVLNGASYEELDEYYAPLSSWYHCRFHPAPGGGVTIFFTDSTEQHRTNHRLKLALDGGRMGVWEFDYRKNATEFDERLRDLFEMLPENQLGSADEFLAAIHPEDREGVQAAAALAVERKEEFDHEFRVLKKDGGFRWVEGKAAVTRDSSGTPISMVGVSFDITGRKENEQELIDLNGQLKSRVKERTAHLQTIGENVPGFFSLVDRDFRYVFVNQFYEEAFGIDRSLIDHRLVEEVVGEELWGRIGPRLQAALNGKDQNFEVSVRLPAKNEMVLRVCYIPQRDIQDVVTGVYILAIDITKEHRLQQEVLNAGEQEQMRIGTEMHDNLCQQMSGIGLQTKVLAKKLKREGQDTLAEAAEEIVHHTNALTTLARDMARGVAPIQLQGSGLKDALKIFLDQLVEATPQLETKLDIALNTRDLSPSMATQLYRITREAVTNALRHGKATRIDVRFWAIPKTVFLAILDNGTGKPEELANLENEGLGLRSMKYRARMLGGILKIESGIGRPGIQILCRLPIEHLEISQFEL